MKLTWIVAALCMGVAGVSHADDAIKDANRQVRFSAGGKTIEYHEYDNYGQTNGGWLDSENGTNSYLKLSYSLQGDALGAKDLYFDASFGYTRGNINYDGYLQNYYTGELTPYQATTHSSTSDVDVRFGKGFRFMNDKLQLTPLVTYSSHNWKRDLGKDTYGYREVYTHDAFMLGLMGQVAITPDLVFSADASYGRTMNPKMTVENVVDFKLKSKPISTLGLGLDYRLNKEWRIHSAYRLTKFKYGESAAQYGVYEPESTSTLTDFYAGVGYSF